ncbi:MAG: peptidoglycan DD-metalloendopeptidase family protein [Dehalococcoidia bacterium]
MIIRGSIFPHRPRRSRKLLRAQRYPAPAGRQQWSARVSLGRAVPMLVLLFVVAAGALPTGAIEGVTYAGLPATERAMPGSSELASDIAIDPRTGAPAGRAVPAGASSGATGFGAPGAGSSPAASSEDGAPTESGAQAQTQQPPPVFYEYEVQPGDTVSGIAAQFGIGIDYILWNNVDVIDDADSLMVGAKLQVPPIEGIIHSASFGETVSDLAVEYDSTTEAIVNYAANGFGGDPNLLPVGALILIPGGRVIPPEPSAVVPGSSEDPASPSWTPPPLSLPSWSWPATGRITSPFGPTHPLGIDISMVVNTPIAAAMSGTVTFVGGNPCCSYGYHVIIDHGDGTETRYAHLSQFYVGAGQWVNAGDLIGASGNSGYSTGPHLHFEIRLNDIPLNPLAYLP